jgi:hypothetical protein
MLWGYICYNKRSTRKWALPDQTLFWHGPNLKRKYHMASWDLLASPKNVGGLAFTNTRVMNKCLLAKWIFNIESGEDNLC